MFDVNLNFIEQFDFLEIFCYFGETVWQDFQKTYRQTSTPLSFFPQPINSYSSYLPNKLSTNCIHTIIHPIYLSTYGVFSLRIYISIQFTNLRSYFSTELFCLFVHPSTHQIIDIHSFLFIYPLTKHHGHLSVQMYVFTTIHPPTFFTTYVLSTQRRGQ